MIQLEKNKEYLIHFMPNLHNLNNLAVTLDCVTKINPHKHTYIFSYAIIEDEMQIFKYSSVIKEYIDYTRNGFFGTSEGYYIPGYVDNDNYYATADKSDIITEEQYFHLVEINHESVNNYIKFYDIVYYDPINLFDIKCKYDLHIKTIGEQGFLRILTLGLTERETPIYSDGDDKNSIKKLWDNISIQNEIDIFKEKFKDIFLYDSEGVKYYWDSIQKKHII